MRIHAKVDGLGDLAAALGRAERAVTDGSRAANRRLADTQAAQMRGNVPVETGRLRSTIRVEDSGRDVTVAAGDGSTPYLGFVELGTRYKPARPFVRPAAGRSESRLESEQLAEARRRMP